MEKQVKDVMQKLRQTAKKEIRPIYQTVENARSHVVGIKKTHFYTIPLLIEAKQLPAWTDKAKEGLRIVLQKAMELAPCSYGLWHQQLFRGADSLVRLYTAAQEMIQVSFFGVLVLTLNPNVCRFIMVGNTESESPTGLNLQT